MVSYRNTQRLVITCGLSQSEHGAKKRAPGAKRGKACVCQVLLVENRNLALIGFKHVVCRSKIARWHVKETMTKYQTTKQTVRSLSITLQVRENFILLVNSSIEIFY